MADLGNFDARQVEPLAPMEAIPAGKYVAAIVDSESKPTKSGSGSYLELKFQILEGEHEGRYLWTRLNLDNPNSKAVEIARAELSSICRAVDVLAPRDSSELHNIPLTVTVRCRKRDDTGEITNEIKAYSAPDRVAAAPDANAPWVR